MRADSSNLPASLDDRDEDESFLFAEPEAVPAQWQLKKLKPLHRKVASLIAQGGRNVDIAKIMDVTPQYVHMLSKQPLVREFISEICAAADLRMEALTEKVVDTIAETLDRGSEAGKLKAARMQLEATKRIGRQDPTPKAGAGAEDRLLLLAERLIYLQSGRRPPGVFSEAGEEITDAEFSEPSRSEGIEPAQETGEG